MKIEIDWKKIVPFLMYFLPVVFFVVCYFLIICSGEDIHQGAGTAPNVWADAVAAFRHNSRLSDMYAWAVINFFDYRFSFGVDTIFRLVDVAMGVGVIYLMTYLMLGRKPRLELKDAGLWLLSFVAIFLTPHGRVLYAGFSAIHNYLIIAIVSLAFAVPYVKRLRGEEVKLNIAVMAGAGVIFGLSSNLTPMAFVISYVLMRVFFARKKRVFGWEIAGIVGAVVGILIAYLCGPGVSLYAESEYASAYDYVSLGSLMSAPVEGVMKIGGHMVVNFARVFAPIVVIVGVGWVMAAAGQRRMPRFREAKGGDRKVLVGGLCFVIIHILIASQIAFPLRVALPAYLVAVIAVGVVVKNWKIGWGGIGVLAVATVGIIAARTVLAVEYLEQTEPVLTMIEESEGERVCVERESVRSKTLPVVYLGQEDMLAEWAMPETVHKKEVEFCER